MKTINFFGGPCAGKSTAASGLFYEMKKQWLEAEYVQEYAKELVWGNSSHLLSEQNYIFSEQEHRLNRLREKVDIAISDAPLLLSSFYAPQNYPESFHRLVFDFFETYDNINFFVKRSHHYSLKGRLQSMEEADHIANELQLFLNNNHIPHWEITASNASPKRLLTWLIKNNFLVLPSDLQKDFKLQEIPDNWIKYIHYKRDKNNKDNHIVKSNLSNVKTT